MNLLLLCLNSSILLSTGPQKSDRSVWLPVKFVNSLHHWTFIPKKYLSLVFYDNRNLEISKSKKSEQYFPGKIEIFIRLFDEHFVRHFESHWRETWRHTGRRTVPKISLDTFPHLAGTQLFRDWSKSIGGWAGAEKGWVKRFWALCQGWVVQFSAALGGGGCHPILLHRLALTTN